MERGRARGGRAEPGEDQGVGEEERERESSLNVVGPLKAVGTSSTGQTGCPDRSDRSRQADKQNFSFGDLLHGFETNGCD